jgi:hypothetical protein
MEEIFHALEQKVDGLKKHVFKKIIQEIEKVCSRIKKLHVFK